MSEQSETRFDHNEPSFSDNVDAVLRDGVLVVSFERLSLAIRDRRLERAHLMVLAILLEHINNDTGLAWPSRGRIAELCGLSTKTVGNCLYELKSLGYVDWERRSIIERPEKTAVHYTIPVARMDRAALEAVITQAIGVRRQQMRSAPPAGKIDQPLPRPRGREFAPPTAHVAKDVPRQPGKKTAPPAGYAPPAGQPSAPPTGQPSAPPMGQQELTKERTDEPSSSARADEADGAPRLPLDEPCENPSSPSEAKPDKVAKRSKPPKPVPGNPEGFAEFWAAYPDKRNNSKFSAIAEWRKLSSEQQAMATASLPAFAAYCKANPDYRVVHAERYLKFQRFEAYAGEPVEPARPWWKDPAKVATLDPERWRSAIAQFANGIWLIGKLGPPPGDPECVVPQAVIDELQLMERYDRRGIAKGAR